IKGIAKRGKELKVFVQYKRGGGVRVAGLDIGNYHGAWDKLFQNRIEVMKRFLLITDGDTSILDGLKDKVKVLIQRCLWHIPYQAGYVLWEDGVKHKSREWLQVMSDIPEICAIRPFVDCQKTIEKIIESKRKRLEGVMRTVNMRVHVSKWSDTGALNVTKIRLAYYDNGFDA
ncbi:MAG: hypothetical protein HW390_39, partial [Candidatus Brocadiaceae bacterium]|nr:hypothetical protein [Candidatus Brocadiaceae bacterium]